MEEDIPCSNCGTILTDGTVCEVHGYEGGHCNSTICCPDKHHFDTYE